MRVVRRVAVVGTLAVTLLSAVPARAAVPTTWTAPVTLDRPNEVGRPAAVGMDAAGNALALWLADTGTATRILRSATRPAGGDWSAPTDRTDRVEFSDPVAFAEDSSGRAVVAWSQWNGAHFTARAATIGSDGAWSSPLEVSASDESALVAQAAISDDGQAVVAWRSDTGVKSATYQFGGTWSAPDTLTADPQATAVAISSNATGDVTAAWWLGNDREVQATTRLDGGAWSAPQMLSQPGVETGNPSVAQGPGGNALATWSELHAGTWAVVTSDRTGGAWTTPATLLDPVAAPPLEQLRTDAAGNTVLLLVGFVPGSGNAARASTRPAGGTWGNVVSLGVPGLDVTENALSTNGGGDALVAMTLLSADGTSRSFVQNLPRGGAWTPPLLVSDASVYVEGAAAALDDAGDAVVAWSNDGTIPPTVQAVASPAPVAPPVAPPPIFKMPAFTG